MRLGGDGKGATRVAFPVKRFRCKSCGGTFSILPAFVLVLKRYAAGIVQGAWEDRVDERPRTLEEVVGRWSVTCVETVRQWLRPLAEQGELLNRELTKELPCQASGQYDVAGMDARGLLELARRVADHTPCTPFDRFRVPYHFVLSILRR